MRRWLAFTAFAALLASEVRKPVIWRDPGDVASIDFAGGPGGREAIPTPPFTFYSEDKSGRSPKLFLKDVHKRTYGVKWGEEVKAETFATRMLHAVGYFADSAYYVASGKIDSVGRIGKAAEHIDRANGNAFTDARFELHDPNAHYLPVSNWNFVNNPFRGTEQLNGLKIMMMLLSNWDVKDERSSDGPNTALVEHGGELRYMITDWGGSMGKWGNIAQRSKWDCEGYASQSDDFVEGVEGNIVEFGYSGKRADDIRRGITVKDVRWLMQYLGRVSDGQIRDGLRASGATPEEVECFTKAIRSRIQQLAKL